MERYKEYVETGLNWMPNIPSHWKQVQFRGLFNITKRIAGKTGLDVLAVTQKGIRIKDVESNEGQIASDYSKYQIVEPGDFAMNHMDLITGFIGISSYSGVTSPDYRVFKNISPLANSRYYLYLFEFCYKQRIFFGLGHGVSNKGRWRLPAPVQNRFSIPLPPLPEQEKIVSYLDSKTSKIDAYVAEKEKELQLLNELKESEIANVVTKGLKPDVKMKDSGISWIGMIPEHWEVNQLRAFLKLYSIKGHGDAQLLSVTREQGVIIRDKDNKEENHNFVPEDLSGYKYIEKGDFVINKMKAWQGSYAVSKYNGIVSPAYFTCKLSGVDKEFFSIAVRSKAYVSFFTSYSKGIRVGQWDLDPNALKSIPFYLPPSDEQRAIVSYIETKCAKINSLIFELEAEIEYLKEYKQRLIADCVTGKINVQNINN